MARGGRGKKKEDEHVREFHLSLNTLLILIPIAISLPCSTPISWPG